MYWEAANAQWYGPLGVGSPATTYSAPAMALGSTGLPVISVQGSADSLLIYAEGTSGQWGGPVSAGQPGTAYSAPAMASGANGLPTVAVQGPANSLWAYAETARSQWQVTMGVGAIGSTFSAPAITIGGSGLATVAVQGPANSLWLYWQTSAGEVGRPPRPRRSGVDQLGPRHRDEPVGTAHGGGARAPPTACGCTGRPQTASGTGRSARALRARPTVPPRSPSALG